MCSLDVSIILVSYNTKEHTRNCLKSIYEKTKDINFDIYVVDNASEDDTCTMIKSEFPDVHLIENKENIGFGRANNIAINLSEAKYVFLLNTDTILINNAVKILFDFIEKNSKIGACGGNLYDINNKNVHSYGYFKTLKSKLEKTFKLGYFFPIEHLKNKDKGNNENDLVKEVDIIIGADLMIKKEALDKSGLFDEEFFLYEEESELQYRIKQSGYKIYIYPEAKIYHLEGKSASNRISVRVHKMKSEILCYKKCYGIRKLKLFKFACFISNFPKIFVHPIIILKTLIEIRNI